MRYTKFLSLLLAVFMILGLFSGCNEDYKDAFIYIDFDTVPTNLDPQLADTDEEFIVVRSLFDTLLRYDADGKIVPSGAQTFEKSGNTYTFKLRTDAKWIDGTPVTAHDYLFAIKRAVDPATKAPFANSLYSIAGAEDINSGKADMSVLGASADDDYTLTIKLCKEDTEFEKVLTSAVMMPCNEEYFKACKGKYGLSLDTTPSNGSYYIRKWTRETKFLIRLAKNLEYKGPFEANSMRIYYTCGEEVPADMLGHDNTDLVYLSSEEFSAVADKGFETVKIENISYCLFISDSIDPVIRKALMQSVSSDSYKGVLETTQSPSDSVYPKVLLGDSYVKVTDYIKHDCEGAAALYNNQILSGVKFDGVTIKYPENETCRKVASSIAAHWQQKLSCFINIEEASQSSIATSYYGNYYDTIILPFSAPTGTVSDYNAKLGFESSDMNSISKTLYENYNCYPLFTSTTNIGVGSKIQNIGSAVHGGIIDASILIKQP
jgi:oligopeptide transport system substrate-binding protein